MAPFGQLQGLILHLLLRLTLFHQLIFCQQLPIKYLQPELSIEQMLIVPKTTLTT